MSILRGAIGLLAAGTAAAAYQAAKNSRRGGDALGAAVVTATAASVAAHALTGEVRELRHRVRRIG
ncbi:hypothetical protein KF840_19370 [bacterium]|nr:hypothetical protein [bacterium]